jgi:uncharacterized glyoxalase superfamily protein PhnB
MSSDPPFPPAAPKRSDPEAFRARTLSVSLTVKDLATSMDWYRVAVGFAVDRTYERDGRPSGAVMKAGNVRILLNQDDGARGADREKGVGFSIHFTTVQDVDEIADRIKADGGSLETEPTNMPWGARAFRVRDPDGFMLAISSERHAAE